MVFCQQQLRQILTYSFKCKASQWFFEAPRNIFLINNHYLQFLEWVYGSVEIKMF